MTGRAIAKLLLGFALGFTGAFATLQAIDRFDADDDPDPLEIVIGAPDFDAYCERGPDNRLRAVATTGDAFGWQCAGVVRQLWTTHDVEVADVCRWQYGDVASARLVDAAVPEGWLCVTDP